MNDDLIKAAVVMLHFHGYHKEGDAVRDMQRELVAMNAQEPVAWMAPNKERLEFSRPDTVYGSHTIPLYKRSEK